MPDPVRRVSVGGNFDFPVNDSQRFDMVRAELRMTGQSGQAKTLELTSMDIGVDAAALDRSQPGHYPIGTLRIGPASTTVELVDVHDNDGLGQGTAKALYVESRMSSPQRPLVRLSHFLGAFCERRVNKNEPSRRFGL